jgi:H+/Cl- antiporter ClcA
LEDWIKLMGRPASTAKWRRALDWTLLALGGVVVAVFMLGFDAGEKAATEIRAFLFGLSPFVFLLITPLTFGVIRYLTLRYAPFAAGSGIPQVLGVIRSNRRARAYAGNFLLSPLKSLFKGVAVVVAMAAGGTVGREGPAIQIGASLMSAWCARWVPRMRVSPRMIVTAGAATGLAAAFSTPVAAVLYAFEDLSAGRKLRSRGFLLLPILVAFLCVWALGHHVPFFTLETINNTWPPVWAGLGVTVLCGLVAGVMGWAMVIGLPALLPVTRTPLQGGLLAAALGLLLALFGIVTAGLSMGSGNDTSALLLNTAGEFDQTTTVGLIKTLSMTLTFASGIPAGILTPSLAAGAGFGNDFAVLFALESHRQALVAIGMAAFMAGVIRAPVTCAILIAELTGLYGLLTHFLVAALIGTGAASLILRESLYEVLFKRLLDPLATVKPEQPKK